MHPMNTAVQFQAPRPVERIREAPAQVLLIDGDPISRHVLGDRLRGSEQVRLIAAVDSRLPVADRPVRRADLAILVAGPLENHVLKVEEFTRRGTRVVLIGVDWTRNRLEVALAAGVSGCLSKDWALAHLLYAATAATAGYVVLSPDLVPLCISAKPIRDGRSLEHQLSRLTTREREVLTLLAEGMSTTEVSDTLVVSPATVKSHVSHALTKLGVRNRLEAVLLMQAALGCGIQHTGRPAAPAGTVPWQVMPA